MDEVVLRIRDFYTADRMDAIETVAPWARVRMVEHSLALDDAGLRQPECRYTRTAREDSDV